MLKRISINITKECNLRCKHCLTRADYKDKDELETKNIFSLIDQMEKIGSPSLSIGGGEPLMKKDIFKILEYATRKNIPTSIITNSLLINEKIARKLNSVNLEKINISLDGLEKNHDFMRGKGNFINTVEKIKLLRKHCCTKIGIESTITSLNIKDCIKLIRLAEKLKLDSIRLSPVLPFGRVLEGNEYLLLSQEEYLLFLKKCEKIKANIEIVLPTNRLDSLSSINGFFGCHCGREILWIDYTGEAYPCIFFGENYTLGNIKKEKLTSLWKKSLAAVNLEGNATCNSCSNLSKCRGGCRARALWLYEDINAVDPYCILNKNPKRAPYQVLIFPYVKENNNYLYCIFDRKDLNFWQGVSGGGEEGETILESAKRELFEETNVLAELIRLDSMTTIPSENIGRYRWKNILVVPEYSYGARFFSKKIKLGEEHSEYKWLPYKEAKRLLKYDSNKNALWELNKRLLIEERDI